MVTANPRAFRKVTRKAAYGVYATASKGRGGSISLQEIVWTTARTIAATGRAGKGKIEHCGYCGFEAMPVGSVKLRIIRRYDNFNDCRRGGLLEWLRGEPHRNGFNGRLRLHPQRG